MIFYSQGICTGARRTFSLCFQLIAVGHSMLWYSREATEKGIRGIKASCFLLYLGLSGGINSNKIIFLLAMFPLQQTCENYLYMPTGNFLWRKLWIPKTQRNKHISTSDRLNHHQMRLGLKQYSLTWQSQLHRLIYDSSLSD